jgi:hypothetical protein
MPGEAGRPPQPFKYQVLKGNESVLMREALEARSWWAPAAEGGAHWNLWWGGNGQRFPWDKFPGGCASVDRGESRNSQCRGQHNRDSLELPP